MAANCEAWKVANREVRLRELELEVHVARSVVASSCRDAYSVQLTYETSEEDLPHEVGLDSTNVTGWADL